MARRRTEGLRLTEFLLKLHNISPELRMKRLFRGRVLLKQHGRTLHLLIPGVDDQGLWLHRVGVITLIRLVGLADRTRVDVVFVGALAISATTELFFDAHEVLLSVASNL